MGLRQLHYMADVQESAISTALVPLREGPKGAVTFIRQNWPRLLIFATNGLAVFLTGLAVQIALIRYAGMSHIASYVVQTLFSVQLNFLLSRYITWKDRDVTFVGALFRFNTQQILSTGVGMAAYAGLDKFGMNYIAANVVVTAVLTPASFALSHNWSMDERAGARTSLSALPWTLIPFLAVQVLLSLRLIWTNTAYTDEALYMYSGGQQLNHWLHGSIVEDYQKFFSGSPAIYPPISAMADAVGGLTGSRLLTLAFMLGTTSLLYAITHRLLSKRAAIAGTALFVSLGVTQFLSALATYDSMALFLLALSAYLVAGRQGSYDTLTDIARSTVIAGGVLALANATKYATALWDPVVFGIAWCTPVIDGYSWRYGLGRAIRFTAAVLASLAIGISIGKAKYIQGILTTTLNRSASQIGMGQSASLVFHDTWIWVGPVLVITLIGACLIPLAERNRPLTALGAILLFAAVAAPLNQARIGTSVSLQKHVVFGAWFGCIIAGYAISKLLRFRALTGIAAVAIALLVSVFYTAQSTGLYHVWPKENPAFITALRPLLHPGKQQYLIEGHSAVTAYYIGPEINSLQWKDAEGYAYTDPQSGVTYSGKAALADAIKHRVFTLIIINFNEPADYSMVSDIAKYGGYRFLVHLPPAKNNSYNHYTVWRVTKG